MTNGFGLRDSLEERVDAPDPPRQAAGFVRQPRPAPPHIRQVFQPLEHAIAGQHPCVDAEADARITSLHFVQRVGDVRRRHAAAEARLPEVCAERREGLGDGCWEKGSGLGQSCLVYQTLSALR